jgi:hypothetical protein
MIGTVISYEEVSYIIKFTVPGRIEEAKAIPLNSWDRPNEGDEVQIFELESAFGCLYTYHKMGDRDTKIHKMQTDKFEVILNEDKNTLNIKFIDKLEIDIDVNNNKIVIDSSQSEVSMKAKKVHIGDNGNEPAVLGDKYEKRFKDLYAALASHTHGSSMGPTTPPLPPELVKFQATFPNTLSQDKSKNVDIMK